MSTATFAAVFLCVCLLTGCARPADAGTRKDEIGRKAEVTPAIAKAAEEILKAHPDAAIGSEYRFSVDGRRYVGRIEIHDNPAGEPGRPPGKHRGVTVYLAD